MKGAVLISVWCYQHYPVQVGSRCYVCVTLRRILLWHVHVFHNKILRVKELFLLEITKEEKHPDIWKQQREGGKGGGRGFKRKREEGIDWLASHSHLEKQN